MNRRFMHTFNCNSHYACRPTIFMNTKFLKLIFARLFKLNILLVCIHNEFCMFAALSTRILYTCMKFQCYTSSSNLMYERCGIDLFMYFLCRYHSVILPPPAGSQCFGQRQPLEPRVCVCVYVCSAISLVTCCWKLQKLQGAGKGRGA